MLSRRKALENFEKANSFMLVNAIKKIETAMFPIFRMEQLTNQQINVRVAGTGFFINSSGVFISVAHIFDDATPQTTYAYLGRLPNDLVTSPLNIVEVARNDQSDIYIGRVQLSNTGFLNFSSLSTDPGRTACVAGYPLAALVNNSQGGIELSGVRRYFQPSFILDNANANVEGPGIIRHHDGFLVRDVGLFGMSGGPVFDINGDVLGVQGSVTNPRESRNGDRVIIVENALVIKNSHFTDLLTANKIPFIVGVSKGE